MSQYKIKAYSKQQAQKLGVKIKPSTNPKKKVDVYKDGEKIASIGAAAYMDYPSWMIEKGPEYAEKRRKLYKIRHQKDRTVKNSAGWFSDRILW